MSEVACNTQDAPQCLFGSPMVQVPGGGTDRVADMLVTRYCVKALTSMR
jgi:hypothetical protein